MAGGFLRGEKVFYARWVTEDSTITLTAEVKVLGYNKKGEPNIAFSNFLVYEKGLPPSKKKADL